MAVKGLAGFGFTFQWQNENFPKEEVAELRPLLERLCRGSGLASNRSGFSKPALRCYLSESRGGLWLWEKGVAKFQVGRAISMRNCIIHSKKGYVGAILVG